MDKHGVTAKESNPATAADTLPAAVALEELVGRKCAKIGVIGLGYVGLPLAMAVTRAGFATLGIDTDPDKISALHRGDSYIGSVSGEELAAAIATNRFTTSADMFDAASCDVLVICVPTPLSVHRDPDLSFVVATLRSLATTLRHGQLVILESTTYPGTCDEVMKPILEASGYRCGEDFFIGFSPEREDPGNPNFHTVSIPKIVSGDGEWAAKLVNQFYSAVVQETVPVSSTRVAEAVKITENVFRSVNVALVNELKMIFTTMDIDIWEVIDAICLFIPGQALAGIASRSIPFT
jgi:UDP-N-acetyl-D-glucosamine dehydrogenase